MKTKMLVVTMQNDDRLMLTDGGQPVEFISDTAMERDIADLVKGEGNLYDLAGRYLEGWQVKAIEIILTQTIEVRTYVKEEEN